MQAESGIGGWLLYHSVGRFPGQEAAINAVLADFSRAWCATDDTRWAVADAGRREVFSLWAELIGAPIGSIMGAENVTAAFSAFVEALPAGILAGRSVLIAEDCFPSLHFLLSGLAERDGFRLVTVRTRPGAPGVEEEDFLAAWDASVALAVITWVTSTASRRADLPALLAHGQKHGSLVAVDITQGVGILPFDVVTTPVDFAASTCLKWMCGVPGAGIGYVAPGLLETLRPRLRGWFSQPDPFNWHIDRFSLAADARRFDSVRRHTCPISRPSRGCAGCTRPASTRFASKTSASATHSWRSRMRIVCRWHRRARTPGAGAPWWSNFLRHAISPRCNRH